MFSGRPLIRYIALILFVLFLVTIFRTLYGHEIDSKDRVVDVGQSMSLCTTRNVTSRVVVTLEVPESGSVDAFASTAPNLNPSPQQFNALKPIQGTSLNDVTDATLTFLADAQQPYCIVVGNDTDKPVRVRRIVRAYIRPFF